MNIYQSIKEKEIISINALDKENLKRIKSQNNLEKKLKEENKYKISNSTRTKIIDYFKKLFFVNKFTQGSFFLACYYMDYISFVTDIKSINIGLYSIGCFILASKLI